MAAGGMPTIFQGSALHEAAFFGNLEAVKEWIGKGRPVGHANGYDITPLILAAMKDRLECLQELISAGADVNYPSRDGWSAVACAARNDQDKCVAELVKAGADVNLVDGEGFSPISRAGSCGFIVTLGELLKGNADINQKVNNGRTAIFSTTFSSEEELIEEYTSFGRIFDPQRQSLVKCADILIEAGADVNAVDPDENTPLTLAARCGNLPCLKSFIRAGADVNYKKPRTDETALMIAEQNGHTQCADELRAASK